ncbi:MAG TPA: CpsD/CapB family tyrosine-protein kinase [Bacilli bacterium]
MLRSTNEQMLITDVHPRSPISEAYRTLRTNIRFSSVDQQLKILLVTSTQAGEGKTTTVTNLAAAYAQENKKVLIIDADLRKPSIHHVFNLSNRNGLTSILTDQFVINEVVAKTHINHLSVITSGPIPPNPSEMLTSKRMLSLLAELKEVYDVILIDSPPTLAVTDSQILAAMCDGVILVINYGKVKREFVKKAKDSLEHVKARILGAVINNVDKSEADSYYYYYGSKENS